MTVWQFVLANTVGAPLVELPATSMQVQWHLDDPAEASCTVDGLDPRASEVQELLTDLLVYRDSMLVFRGRIVEADDSVGDSHDLSLRAIDYRGLLARRVTYAGTGWGATDQAQIAWNLIAYAQGLIGGSWGITRGTGQSTGVLRDRLYVAGANVGELLDNLGRVINGYDWEIDANLALNIFHPTRGTSKDWVAEYENTVTSFRRSVSSDAYANAVRATGADTLTPVTVTAANLASRPEGRWDQQIGDTDITQQATVTEKANGALARGEVLLPSYTCTVDPDRWTPESAWVGDSTQLVLRSGRLDVAAVERIESVSVSIDDAGAETVALTYGQRRRELEVFLLRFFGARLTNLERR